MKFQKSFRGKLDMLKKLSQCSGASQWPIVSLNDKNSKMVQIKAISFEKSELPNFKRKIVLFF